MPSTTRVQRRPAELLTAAYLAITGGIALVCGPSWTIVALHSAGVVAILAVMPRLPDVVRDWIPVALLPLLYMEIGLINQFVAPGYHDAVILTLEHRLFPVLPHDVLRRALPWRPLASYFEFGYLAYYALLPMLGLALYRARRIDEYRDMLTVVLITFYICYLCFVCFPVAGPWYARAHSDGLTDMLLTHGSSKGAAFPSSHVAVATVIWLLAWRYNRRVFWVMAAIVPALIVGTVYGGYHYAFDALAGLLLGLAAYLMPRWAPAPRAVPAPAAATRPLWSTEPTDPIRRTGALPTEVQQ
jgi:membrane-associated phospholipid phosphatase